ncbi:MAG: hypothetical protein A2086_00895 [Spirochaetes bacterium GWD1_27_9]|nr:MAG: hypothetical protein A2Z98_03900 [Spirochaetes bacterium GWB1_27_13]OHD26792.1 MAG: hypothetical protein A2Y34_18030 [Spirochaetes bacterium GWC1_27_15]OHD33610.1 MAG: hypothetical protein A2086_00895 [Spirochaetes bacterium GWD1_27_9]
MTNEIEVIDIIQKKIFKTMKSLISYIGEIPIGKINQFPYGWRKAAKGRTVWRILEEIITQNLEYKYQYFNLTSVEVSSSEISVYDIKIRMPDIDEDIFVNVKSSIQGRKNSKDDLSKAEGLIDFYNEDSSRKLFIVTFIINFKENMTIEIVDCYVMPIAWIPDIYVNPSNNGNLQSSKYKEIESGIQRTNLQFIEELINANSFAKKKKKNKL